MVTYRSITVVLRSTFDPLHPIPEFDVPAADHNGSNESVSQVDHCSEPYAVCVNIPHLVSGQFSIDYAVAPPQPVSMYFYFKLYLDGKHVVSWGVGESENFHGRTSFALFDQTRDTRSPKRLQRRSFFFAGESRSNAMPAPPLLTSETPSIEICVYRADGRRLVPPIVDKFKRNKGMGKRPSKAINLVDVKSAKWYPQRFYQFSLIDHPNQPFATFKYFVKSLTELQALGSIPRSLPVTDNAPVKRLPDSILPTLDGPTTLDYANTEKPLSERYHHSRFVEHCSLNTTHGSSLMGRSMAGMLRMLSIHRSKVPTRLALPEGPEQTYGGENNTVETGLPLNKQLPPIPESQTPLTSSPNPDADMGAEQPPNWPRTSSAESSSRALMDVTRRSPRYHERKATVPDLHRDGVFKNLRQRWSVRRSHRSSYKLAEEEQGSDHVPSTI